MTIRVLLIEDDPDWVEGIKWIIGKTTDILLVAAIPSPEVALQMIPHLEVDVILLDIMFNHTIDGLHAINELLEGNRERKIVMLSSLDDEKVIWDAYLFGAINYIVKSTDYQTIPQAIRDAHNGCAAIHASSAEAIRSQFKQLRQEQARKLLTPQERRILSYVHLGKTTAEICRILCVEEKTIDNHITNINRKLQVKNRRQAAQIALKKGLLLFEDIPSQI
ncbi:response regulator transcription factor [Paenibacillus tarimensis]|uniref:response regulator transcription factor n=1 Tax=Paenibacillus tarimensis TaxID=416012 RepID=UPI001F42C9A5|nr:response regulator transcription factor [Paenibacillus tarimensis]MCF2942780.1 response regulator transcription factor [Paenibacillus tarimensis]